MKTRRGASPSFHTSCSYESSKRCAPPSLHARVSLPTRIAAPAATASPTCSRSRAFDGPQ
eukprot:7386117-Prymnesium_polylepis.1